MKKLIIISLLMIELFANKSITICGTGDSQELLRSLAIAYELKHPNTTIKVPRSIGSGGGVVNAALGKCDLGRVARNIKEEEKKYNLNYILFAYSPVVFVSNQNIQNIKNLTTQDIIGIYSGKIKKWDHFNDNIEGKIYVARRESGDSSLGVLEKNIKGYKDIENFAGKTITNTPQAVNIISKYENTIGYLPISQVVGIKLNIFNFDGVEPSPKNIKDGLYKLVSSFGLVYKGDLNSLSISFINFMSSSQAQNIYKKYGVIHILEED